MVEGLSFSVLPTWFIDRGEGTTGNTCINRLPPSFIEKKTNYSSWGWMYSQEGGRGKRGKGGGGGRGDDLHLWGTHWRDYYRPYWRPYSPLIHTNPLTLSQKFSMVVAHILDELCTCILSTNTCFSVFGYWYTCPRDTNLQRSKIWRLSILHYTPLECQQPPSPTPPPPPNQPPNYNMGMA